MAYLLDHIRKIGELSRFSALIKDAGLDGPLNGPGQFTVFAPNDEAFTNAPQDILATHMMPGAKRRLLLHHVVYGFFDESALRLVQSVTNADQKPLKIGDDYAVLRISGARIIKTDIKVDNGVLHVIERVLWPG